MCILTGVLCYTIIVSLLVAFLLLYVDLSTSCMLDNFFLPPPLLFHSHSLPSLISFLSSYFPPPPPPPPPFFPLSPSLPPSLFLFNLHPPPPPFFPSSLSLFHLPHFPLSVSPSPCRSEDANKSFSAAVQLYDSLVRGWALWGEYLDKLFELDSNITLGLSVITCYLHACRAQKEAKCRKYLARIIWLLTHDDQKGTLAEVCFFSSLGPFSPLQVTTTYQVEREKQCTGLAIFVQQLPETP